MSLPESGEKYSLDNFSAENLPVFHVLLLLLQLASCIDVGTPGKKSVRSLFSDSFTYCFWGAHAGSVMGLSGDSPAANWAGNAQIWETAAVCPSPHPGNGCGHSNM